MNETRQPLLPFGSDDERDSGCRRAITSGRSAIVLVAQK